MASNINPNNIDGSYPVAGQDNSSQGFRDNFTNIKVNFQYAAEEIDDLQNNVLLKSPLNGSTLDNNMNNNLIYAANIQDFSATAVALSTTSGAIDINYAAGHYQSISATGNISLTFSNFPAPGFFGVIRIAININPSLPTLTLPASVSRGLSGIQGISPGTPGVTNTISFNQSGWYQFQFTSSDGGNTITLFDLNRALTNFDTADISIDELNATVASVSGNVTAGNIATAGTANLTNIVGTTASLIGNISGANIATNGLISAAGNITGGNITAKLRPPAGTVTIPPLQLTSGVNMTTPAAGSFEYDGVVFYGSPQTNQRGVVQATQFVVLTSNNTTLGDNTNAQNVFNSPSNGMITLAANTTYFMEGLYYITRSAGTNSHTLSTLFNLGGTINGITYVAETTSTNDNILGPVSRVYSTSAAAVGVTAASTTAAEHITVSIRGIIRTDSAGSVTPQIQYSAAPGGAPTVLANSYFRFTPMGNGSVNYVGYWS